jgi:hypothetical protein
MGFTYTTRFAFAKPDAGQNPWHAEMNENLERIDGVLPRRMTISLALDAASGTVELGASFAIMGEIASSTGRFRLYRTTEGRDADITRLITVDAPSSVGLLLEDLFLDGALAIAAVPAPGGPSGGTLCAWSWDGAAGATLTLDILQMEA